MPLQLHFSRAKCFVSDSENGTKKFLAQPAPRPQTAPFWIAATSTFKQGIKDGSIVNLTPPEQMPGYKPAPVAVVEEDAVVEAAEEKEAEKLLDEDDVAQTEVPQAPFGSQPMTPVAPAPKVGSVRASGSRSR